MSVLIRALLALMLGCWTAASAQTVVTSFTPDGAVAAAPAARQAVARFSAPMVAFGDLRAPAPFEVACSAAGNGRWIDAQTWAYDFARDLPGATVCRFGLRADLRDLAGRAVAGRRDFSVRSGGPGVVASQPRDGATGIDEQQAFLLVLSAEVADEAIERHAWCRADGVAEKIGVRVLKGPAREQAMLHDLWFARQYLHGAPRAGTEDGERAESAESAAALRTRLRTELRAGRLKHAVVLQCARTLPADTEVALVWGAGLAAPNGIATEEEHKLSFKTRPEFSATFSCERQRARPAFRFSRCASLSARPSDATTRHASTCKAPVASAIRRGWTGTAPVRARWRRSSCPGPSPKTRA